MGNEGQMVWENRQTCCCCDHQCNSCKRNNQQYSVSELEELILYVHQFQSVLSLMEEQMLEDQANVYCALNDQDREKIQDIVKLRQAVKQEARELELQLNELVHHDDDSLRAKMHRLLDEQSLLCSQLRLFSPEGLTQPAGLVSGRTVATQSCLLPWPSEGDPWDADDPRQTHLQSASSDQAVGCSPAKADKLPIVGFLNRLRESLRHSVNTD